MTAALVSCKPPCCCWAAEIALHGSYQPMRPHRALLATHHGSCKLHASTALRSVWRHQGETTAMHLPSFSALTSWKVTALGLLPSG